MKSIGILFASVIPFLLVACGGNAGDDLLVENAAFTAALEVGEPDSTDGVPDGELDGAVEEAAEEVVSEPDPVRECGLDALRARVREAYDANGDGSLDEDERGQLREDFDPAPKRFRRWARHHKLERLKWIYDADEDRALSEEERQELRNDLETRCENRKAQLLAQFDADENGALDDIEWETAKDAIRARIRARHQAALADIDQNGDDRFTQMERQRYMGQQRTRMQQRREAMVETYDADGSGDLDADERAALREHLKSRIRGEHFGADVE